GAAPRGLDAEALLERHLQSDAEETRVVARRRLAVVRVVRAWSGGRRRAVARAGLHAGLTEERARGIDHEAAGRVEVRVERGDRLPVERVVQVGLRRDRDRSDVD